MKVVLVKVLEMEKQIKSVYSPGNNETVEKSWQFLVSLLPWDNCMNLVQSFNLPESVSSRIYRRSD